MRNGHGIRDGKRPGRTFHAEALYKNAIRPGNTGVSERFKIVNAGQSLQTGGYRDSIVFPRQTDDNRSAFQMISD